MSGLVILSVGANLVLLGQWIRSLDRAARIRALEDELERHEVLAALGADAGVRPFQVLRVRSTVIER